MTNMDYTLTDYARTLHDATRPEWRPLINPAVVDLLAKAEPPGRARGAVPQARLAAERQALAALVGRVPGHEIAAREAELNRLEEAMRARGWV